MNELGESAYLTEWLNTFLEERSEMLRSFSFKPFSLFILRAPGIFIEAWQSLW